MQPRHVGHPRIYRIYIDEMWRDAGKNGQRARLQGLKPRSSPSSDVAAKAATYKAVLLQAASCARHEDRTCKGGMWGTRAHRLTRCGARCAKSGQRRKAAATCGAHGRAYCVKALLLLELGDDLGKDGGAFFADGVEGAGVEAKRS
jgi:hypothetical protein